MVTQRNNTSLTANGVKSDTVSLASNVSGFSGVSGVSGLSGISGVEGGLCLLEVNQVTLSDMDLFSGVWACAEEVEEGEKVPDEMRFSGR